MTWACPPCCAPVANRQATQFRVSIDLGERFAGAAPAMRAGYDRIERAGVADPAALAIPGMRGTP